MTENIVTLEVRETYVYTLEIRGITAKEARKRYKKSGKSGFQIIDAACSRRVPVRWDVTVDDGESREVSDARF
jgi:hypothetical protein